MTTHRGAGPLADEAALFVHAALTWAQRAAGAIDPTGERMATGAPECSTCPLCRTIGALRDPSPELTERLTHTVTEVATALAAGLRFAFDGATSAGHAAGHPAAAHAEAAGAPAGPDGESARRARAANTEQPSCPHTPHQREQPHQRWRSPGVEHIDIV